MNIPISRNCNVSLAFLFYCIMGILLISCGPVKESSTKVLSASKEMKLMWSDEFELDGLPDHNKWSYDTGDGCPRICGWGNNELQYYTKDNLNNARVEGGNLIIEAHKTSLGSSDYTSARILSKGKGDWKYGKISIRAKLPTGLGTWPAIWMLPSTNKYGNWPNSGEIDIMEHVGYDPDSIYGTVHTTAFNHMIGTEVSKASYHPDAESSFKTYSIEWDNQKIEWLIDGVSYHAFENRNISEKEWPFDENFHLIMNLAVGGNWGGEKGVDTRIWPQRMEVDWVRIYQQI